MVTDKVEGARVGEKGLKELAIPRHLQRAWTVEADFIYAIRAGGRSCLPRERTRFFSPDFEEGVRYMAVTEAAIRGRPIRADGKWSKRATMVCFCVDAKRP